MNVLSVIHGTTFGGPHNRNLQVATLLSGSGVRTTVLLPDEQGNAPQRLRDAGVECVTLPLHRLRASVNPLHFLGSLRSFPSEVTSIQKLIRDRSIDLVQINGLVNLQAAIAASREQKAIVWQILDTRPPLLLRRLVMSLVSRMADSVMCTGHTVAQVHPGALEFGDRLITFFPPVNAERFAPTSGDRDTARRELGIDDQDFVVGNVGNINMQKGHDAFVRGAAKLRRLVPRSRFVILGAVYEHFRRYTSRLRTDAERLGLRLGLDLVLKDPDRRVSQLAQAFDVFWLTSPPKSEGIPTAMEEAMMLGIPVVAFDVGSVREAIQEGASGFVVPCGNIDRLIQKTLFLFENPAKRIQMGVNARAIAQERFSHHVCAEVHLNAYRKALEHAARRAS